MKARQPLIDAMKVDQTYGKYFDLKLVGGSNIRFLSENRPISTREVRRFIEDAKVEADRLIRIEKHRLRVEEVKTWFSQLAAQGDYADSHDHLAALDNKIETMLSWKTENLADIDAGDVERDGISEMLYSQAMAQEDTTEQIKDENQAENLINKLLANILDDRITKAQQHHQEVQKELKSKLSATGLSSVKQQEIKSEIDSAKIATGAALNTRVNGLVVEQVTKRLDTLLDEVSKQDGIDRQFLESLHIENYLEDYLLSDNNQILTEDSAAQKIRLLIREGASSKKAAVKEWIAKLSAADGSADSEGQLHSRIDTMFQAKIADQPGLSRLNVSLLGIDVELRKAAQDAFKDFAPLDNEKQAGELMDQLIATALDNRIKHGRDQLKLRLKEELAEAHIPEQTREEITAGIDNLKITNSSQIKRIIADLVLKKIGNFDALLSDAATRYKFNRDMLVSPRTGERLMKNLDQRLMACEELEELSTMPVRDEALKLLNRQRIDLVDSWIKKHTGLDEVDNAEKFASEVNQRLSGKLDAAPDSEIDLMSPESIGHQIREDILKDGDSLMAISNEHDARTIVLNKLSAVIKPRVEQAHQQDQLELYNHLNESGLSITDAYRDLEGAIDNMQITTLPQLNRAISEAVVKQVDTEFDALVQRVKKGYKFDEPVASLSTVREQLRRRLGERENLSLSNTRNRAMRLLERWLTNKIEALGAIASSKLAGSESLMKELVLQEPYITKHQVPNLQKAIEKTMKEAYSRNAKTYDALHINQQNMIAKLKQIEGGDTTLLGDLGTLVQRAMKPPSIFSNPAWQIADVGSGVERSIASLTALLVNTSRRVKQLKGQIPDTVYQGAKQTMREKGMIWGEDLIGNINAHYAKALKDDTTEFYNLMEAPLVAQQRLNTRSNDSPFTLSDLVDFTIAKPEDVKKAKQRQKAIDKLLPAAQKDDLLAIIGRDLSQQRSAVITSSAANEICRRSALNALQNAKIDFDKKIIVFNRDASPQLAPYTETSL